MGDSYREELEKARKRKDNSSAALVREGAKGRAAIRELYLRKSRAGRRKVVQATQRLNGF